MPVAAALPELAFAVHDAAPAEHAAVPTLELSLGVTCPSGHDVRSVLLDVQVQIATRRRGYDDAERASLTELFGAPEHWATSLRSLPWTRATLVVPAFSGETTATLPLVCTYDLEVAAARYLAALDERDVPLELLFSGTVFFAGPDGRLQIARISWESEAEYRLPVAVWRDVMDRHFPQEAWLRLDRTRFDRLLDFRARHALGSWDATVDALLDAAEAAP